MVRVSRSVVFVVVAALSGCSSSQTGEDGISQDVAGADGDVGEDVAHPSPVAGTQIAMDFAATPLYAAPFPSAHRVGGDGVIDLAGLPNPDDIDFVHGLVSLIQADVRGFGTTSGVFFKLDGALDPAVLPQRADTLEPDAPIQLVVVDPTAPDYGRRYPVTVAFEADAGPFGAENLLSLLPVQGIPLRPRTLYAAVVLRSLKDAQGAQLGVGTPMAQLAAGQRPDGLSEAAAAVYADALGRLPGLGVPLVQIAGVTVFETGDPSEVMLEVAKVAQSQPPPTLNAPFEPNEVFDDYCVFESTIDMPVFQAGEPPFGDTGGGWTFDASGAPILQGQETARVVLTVPRGPQPVDGFPLAVFIRTGGGGERPLVDRGVHAEPHGPELVPGAGPARHFARAGWAGLSVDGPHGGLRNVTGGDEQFLMFNVLNPTALRDNVRQSALELALLPAVIQALSVPSGACDGVLPADEAVIFDPSRLALMGHSMGATIAPLVLAVAPEFDGLVLSGAGGSWIENLVHKLSPIAVKPLAEAILGYAGHGRSLHAHDPALSLVQWAGEAADPPPYRWVIDALPSPPHILMLQGIIDTYILPPIANATALSLGLDLAGDPLDSAEPGLADFVPLADLLGLVDRTAVSLPARGNRDGRTLIVVQHAEDGVEDGHEVVFQTELPKFQYRCFLEQLAITPTVWGAGAMGAGCPAPL